MDAVPPGASENSRQDNQTGPGGKAEAQPRQDRSRGLMIALVVGAVVVLVLIAVGAVALVNNPPLAATLRDIFIIALALESVVIGLVLLLLVIQVTRLINLLQDEIKPILESTSETVNTVRGTTTFVSEKVVTPVVTLSSYATGVWRAIQVIAGLRRPRRPDIEPTTRP